MTKSVPTNAMSKQSKSDAVGAQGSLVTRMLARKGVVVPDEDEWDFSGVPDEELPLCFLYEYGRESKIFRERVDAWRTRHPHILGAARSLLARTAPFGFTWGPSLEQRALALFGERGKTPTKSDIKQADENGNAWGDWGRLTMGLNELNGGADVCWPDGMRADDPRLFLYYFPPFPAKPWLKIQSERIRRIAFPLLLGLGAARNLSLLTLTAGRDLSDAIEWQRQLQAGGTPMDTTALESMVRIAIGQHIFAPALCDAADFSHLPPGVVIDRKGGKITAAGFVHQKSQFVINWSESNKAIKKSFVAWLGAKGRRPHPELKTQNLTTAREYLNKLSALLLLARLSQKDAVEMANAAGIYEDVRSLTRAAVEAEAVLRKIFPE